MKNKQCFLFSFVIVQFCVRVSSQIPGRPLIVGSQGQSIGVALPTSANVPGPGTLRYIENPGSDKGVKKLLDHRVLLSKVQKETKADTAVKIESVLAAHKQVASGMITYLDLKVQKTICPIGVRNAHLCEKDVSEDPYVCEVAIWERPWINSTRVIDKKSKCAEVENDTDFKNWGKNSVSVQVQKQQNLQSLPLHIPKRQVALEAFGYIDRGSDSKFKGRMVDYSIGQIKHDPNTNVTTVQTSVEYGFTYCLKFPNMKLDTRVCLPDASRENYLCKVTVVSAPGLTANLKVLPGSDDDIECEKRTEVVEELIVPLKMPCAGCPVETSINSPSVLEMAEFALNEFDRTSDEDHLHRMVKIIRAETQVVAGIKYILTLELRETHCVKALSAYNLNRTFCEFDVTEESKICRLSIWEQAWISSKQLTDVSCDDKEVPLVQGRDDFIVPMAKHVSALHEAAPRFAKAAVPPTPATAPPGILSPSMQNSIDDFVAYLNLHEDGDDGYYKLLKVHDTSIKMEQGRELQSFVIELGETVCRASQNIQNCPLKPGEDNEMCSVVVSIGKDAQGKESRSILSINCDDADDFIRKSIPPVSHYETARKPIFDINPASHGLPGGPLKEDTTSATALSLAGYIVDQYNLQEDEDEYYKLGKIITLHTQNVESRIHMMELELVATKCKKYQPITDVSQCAIDTTEEVEVCQAQVFVTRSPSGNDQKELKKLYCDDKEDYYRKRVATSLSVPKRGRWNPEDFTSDKAKTLGKMMADEFDSRSDKDHIFVLHSVLDIKSMDNGLKYHVKVELAETVCPKYKRGINKSRCAVDIGEDLKICEADIIEKPWNNAKDVQKLVCYERDDSGEGFDSREVLYPMVHPTAHSRPRFLSVFTRRESKESDESNEKFYINGRHVHFDSDERHHREPHSRELSVTNEATSHQHSDTRFSQLHSHQDFTDSDTDSRSQEHPHLRIRQKRDVHSGQSKLLGGSKTVSTNDVGLLKVANLALFKFDETEGVSKQRKVIDVLSAAKQLVQGYLWRITVTVGQTVCDRPATNLSACAEDTSSPRLICAFTIHEIPWLNTTEVTKAKCHPEI